MAEDQDRPDIVLESNNTASWDMRLDGDINGTYFGKFIFRCFLTPSQQIAANRDYRSMLGDNPTMAPQHESFLAYCLTQLKFRIIQAPPFWNSSGTGGDLADDNVLSAVLDAAISAEVKFRNQLKKKKEQTLERAKSAAEKVATKKEEEEVNETENEESGD